MMAGPAEDDFPSHSLLAHFKSEAFAMSASLFARARRWWNSSNGTVKPRRGVAPRVEALEDRALPSTANQVFLAAVYQGELRRPIDDGGLAAWGNQLDQGISR